MRTTLKMPRLGDAADEVVILELLVRVGELVTEGQSLFLVETDKTQVEVPTPFSGRVVEIVVNAGDEVVTGSPTLAIEV